MLKSSPKASYSAFKDLTLGAAARIWICSKSGAIEPLKACFCGLRRDTRLRVSHEQTSKASEA
jgi:hypothetical protein